MTPEPDNPGSAANVGEQIAVAYMTTGEPYIDEPETCPACGGDGWYVGHDDECYETGDCVCAGVQVECECGALRG